jgi:hypothetical protein
MDAEEQLRRWMADPSEVPASMPAWGPDYATFEQIMIAWGLVWQKQHGAVIGPTELGYVLAGFIVASPGTRAYGWQKRIERVMARATSGGGRR